MTKQSQLVSWVQRGPRRRNRQVNLLPFKDRQLAARRNKDPAFDRACALHQEGRFLEVDLETLASRVRRGLI